MDCEKQFLEAAANGHTATVVELMRCGVNVNSKNEVSEMDFVLLTAVQHGVTALMFAAYKGHTVTAAELMRLGGHQH
jgi:hypothetical protein